MVYSLTYRRPAYVSSTRASSISGDEKSPDGSLRSGSSGTPWGIPEALSFDRIISGGTCPPCTVRDFMNYLKFIELSAENLQFFLWYRDYTRRFDEIPEGERALAKEWIPAQTDVIGQNPQAQSTSQKRLDPQTAALFRGTDFAPGTKENKANPFSTPPRTPGDTDAVSTNDSENASTVMSSTKSHAIKAAGAFESADVKLQPFTIQPFREEISRIISTYLTEDAPRELNISARERVAVLQALSQTTHPSAFRSVANTVESSLRYQAHPNFIRWTICNGNRPRVVFARGLGVAGIVGGFVAALVITLSSAGRGWRALAAIGWIIGIATLIAAWKGMCVVLHGMHHRHLRPWELFAEDDEAVTDEDLKKNSFDSLGSANSYEDQPWVAQYEKRNIIRKVFDREVWIQEPALRQIQDTIFLQAVGGALLLSGILSAVFVAVPKGAFF